MRRDLAGNTRDWMPWFCLDEQRISAAAPAGITSMIIAISGKTWIGDTHDGRREFLPASSPTLRLVSQNRVPNRANC
jgi:hypothetical protein